MRATEDGTFGAENPGQGWSMRFDGAGFEVAPPGEDWTWGLELRSYGRAGKLREAVAGKRLVAEGDRLAVRRDVAIAEWYVNRIGGLMHGFTVSERPAGGGDLEMRFGVRGGLKPRASADGRAVAFGNGTGAAVVNYSGLKVWDADGRLLGASLADVDGEIVLRIKDDEAVYPVMIDPVAQQAFLKASNVSPEDNFGRSVAISGDTVVVGAFGEDSGAVGINGIPNGSAPSAGAVYVFVRRGTTWTQEAFLKASNAGEMDFFGESVAISGDTVVVGAEGEDSGAVGINGVPNETAAFSGAAYVFIRRGTTWTQEAFLKADNAGEGDSFGRSVGIFDDTVVVGANKENSGPVGIGGTPDESEERAGAVYVFARSGSTWTQEAFLKASNAGETDLFGGSVGITGDRVVVGASGEDSGAVGINGSPDESMANSGAAYVFVRRAGIWTQEAFLKASMAEAGDFFGGSVGISGDTVVVGARGEDSGAVGINGSPDDGAVDSGAAYVIVRTGMNWEQQAFLKASNAGAADYFGQAVAISGNTVVVGADAENSGAVGINGSSNESAGGAGAAYVFFRDGTTWGQQTFLKASNAEGGDSFGFSLGISGNTVLVGAALEDSGASGVSGDQTDNSLNSSGACYVFQLDATAPTPAPPGGGGSVVDDGAPELVVRGRKTIETLRKRVVFRGTASDASGIADLDVKARGAKVKKIKLLSGDRFKVVLRVSKTSGRVIVKFRATDGAGLRSKPTKVRILRR